MREWVLVVDDDADLAAVLAELLRSHGLEPELAANGAEALRLLAGRTPLLCILDWFLPDGPPTAVAEACRARHIPVVLSSAARDAQALAAEAGATAVLAKPFDVDSFFRIIDEIRGRDASLVT